MKFICDLHLHSKYSRAVSQDMVLSKMAEWARLKGINVLATGDFTHPFWFEQLKNELEDAGNGLLRLKQQLTTDNLQLTKKTSGQVSNVTGQLSDVYFMLSCEVSSIYSQGGKTRRIHNLFFFPSLSSVEKFNGQLLKRGANLRSDGRPIVGLTSGDLLEIALECDQKALIIPAHIWTPWFSVFGSFSGFDSLSECFGDLVDYVYGVETGLSSDPAMNWRIADLDNKSILSFSDAHSLEKMGREATVFEADEISYENIYKAIARGPVSPFPPASAPPPFLSEVKSSKRKSDSKKGGVRAVGIPSRTATPHNLEKARDTLDVPKIAFTIEFYPEEGKYHYTGHRDCNFSQSPQETAKSGSTCPVCGRSLTVGVLHRVQELTAREISNFKFQISNGVRWVHSDDPARPPYVPLVPLSEILAEALGVGVGTKKVMDAYLVLVNQLGSEFNVLLKADLEDVARFVPQKVVEGIEKVRSGNIVVEPGYDGKFGLVKIWPDSQTKGDKTQVEGEKQKESQLNLFAA